MNSYNIISFGQKVPTSSLLKLGSGIYTYEDAKNFCNIFDKKFPGNVGYYKKALNHINNIESKNPYIQSILSVIKNNTDKTTKLSMIDKYTQELGTEIDVVI